MNTKNNRRRRDSIRRIEDTFLRMLEGKALEDISVSELCKECGLNRSTFYANYMDIYELADRVLARLEEEVALLYRDEMEQGYNSNDFLKLFRHIRDNQLLYRTYFKLGRADQLQLGQFKYDFNLSRAHFGNQYIEYHIEFFRQGFNAIVKLWLMNGCKETPEEMGKILEMEYQGRMAAAKNPS